MVMISLLSISIGVVLSTRWNVFVIFPAIGAALVIVTVVGVARGDSAGWIAVEMAVIIVCLQLGYAAKLVVYVLDDAIRGLIRGLAAVVVRSLKAVQTRMNLAIRHSGPGRRHHTMSEPTQCAVRNTDQEAIDRAVPCVNGRDVEVWEGPRRVTRIGSDAKSQPRPPSTPTPTVTEPRLVAAGASDDRTRRPCHSDDMTAMGCLVRITIPHPQGRPTSTTYVVAERDFAIAIAILGREIPLGGQTENLGAVIGSYVKELELAPGGYIEV